MFNMCDDTLHDSIVLANQKRMLENDQLESERKKANRVTMLDNISGQFNALHETSVSKVHDRTQLIEAATIAKIKGITYDIFEASLLIDDEPKAYYSDVIKKVFDDEFDKLLAGTGVTGLASFKKNFGNANRVYNAVLENAAAFATMNTDVIMTVLETTGMDTVSRSIIEACELLAEADASNESKGEKIREAIEKVRDRLTKSDADLNTIIRTGVDIKAIFVMVLAFKSVWTFVANPLLGVVMMFITIISQDALLRDRVDNAPAYIKQVEDIKANLIKLKDKTDKTDAAQLKKIDKQVERCDNVIKNLKVNEIHLARKNKKLKEDSGEFVADCYNGVISDAIVAGESLLSDMDDDATQDFVNKVKAAVSSDATIENKDVLVKTADALTETGFDACSVIRCLGILYEADMHVNISFLSASCNKKLTEGELPDITDFYTEEDNKMLDDLANINGKNLAIKTIKDKIVTVITNEEENAVKKQQEEEAFLNNLAPDKLEAMKANMNESAGIRLGSMQLNMPETLFSAIVMNRSKKVLSEAAADNSNPIMSSKDTILAESIVLYTIHETFNTLNLKSYSEEDTRKLMNDYYYNKI